MNDDVRTSLVKDMLVCAERRVIEHRTHAGELRSQLSDAEKALGAVEREAAEVRAIAADLNINVSALTMKPGTLHRVLTSVPE